MKNEIHPEYYLEAKVSCACGNKWTTGSTSKTLSTDVCSKCHPFYTGEQRIVDTEGQVDRFYRKLAAREEYKKSTDDRKAAKTDVDVALSELELGKRSETALTEAGLSTIDDILQRLKDGDQAMLDISGFGMKSLSDLKRTLNQRGFEIPVEA